MKNNGCVLVLDGQWRHALSVTRSLGKRRIKVVVGSISKVALSKFSRYCYSRIIYPDPLKFPDDFIEYLKRFLEQEKVDLIIPNEDFTVELLSKHKSQFDEITKVPLGDYGVVSKALDKAQTMKVAIQNDIPCPKTHFIEDEAEISQVADTIEYPAIIKPRKSAGGVGIEKVFSKDEFVKQYHRIHQVFPFPIVQDFIPGPDTKFNFSAILDKNGKTKASFTMEALRLYPHNGGVGTYARSVRNDAVAKYGLKFLKASEWYGIAQVEFKLDPRDNLPKLFEVNPRFWGMTEMAVCSGMDLPYILYRMIVDGDEVEYSEYKTEQYLRWLLPGDILHFITNPNRRYILKNFLRFFDKNLHYAILSSDDPLPTLAVLLSSFSVFFDKQMRSLVFRRF
jgi:predicted ATP-grasp superfamily ATP-dependent carboligase